MRRKFLLLGALAMLAACGGTDEKAQESEVTLKPGDLIITEVMVDSTADTNDDWVEIRNVTDRTICVAGLRLRANLYDSGTFTVPGSVEDCLAPGEFYVFGSQTHDFVDFANEKLKLPATKQEVLLLSGALLIDSARYSAEDATAPLGKPMEGHSFSLCGYCQDAMCTKDAAHWVLESSEMYNDTDYGTPGYATTCSTMPGDVLEEDVTLNCTLPEAGDLLITEVLANSFDEDSGEWFEIYVTEGAFGKHLNGLDVVVDGKSRGVLDGPGCIPLVPGTYLVVGTSPAPFGPDGIQAHVTLPTLKIPNKSALIALMAGELLVDEATYDEKSDGISWQLSGSFLDDLSNDDLLNWCFTSTEPANAVLHADGKTSYASPGIANGICPLVCSPGQCIASNACQAIVPVVAGDVTITEVMANPHDEESGEWFEIRLGDAVAGKHLNGLNVVVDGTDKGTIAPADGACIPATPNGYFAIAKSAAHFADSGLTNVIEMSKLGLKNDAVTLALKQGEDVVAQADYDEQTDGVSYQLNIYNLDAPEAAENWCFTPMTEDLIYDDVDGKVSYGTPGAANTACPLVCNANECADGGMCTKLTPVKPGDLVISEVMADPGSGKGEWFELFVTAQAQGRHLNGLALYVDNAAKGTVASDGACLVAQGNQRLLVGKSKDLFATPYPVKADLLVSGLALKNGTFEIRVEANGLIVDKATYTSKDPGVSYQLSGLFADTTANDNAQNWCFTPVGVETEVEVASFATPAKANVECPIQ